MATKNAGDGPVIIKKYANRRLYDTSTSTYVTLDHLSSLVREGVEFEVRDAKSGEDLTRTVLTQIIFEHETKGDGALPLNFLRQLIGFYGETSQDMLPAWLDVCMNSFAEQQKDWTEGMMNPAELFEKQAKRNMMMFQSAMRLFMPGEPVKEGAAANSQDAASETLAAMRAQMNEMQEQLKALSKKN